MNEFGTRPLSRFQKRDLEYPVARDPESCFVFIQSWNEKPAPTKLK